MSPAIPEIDALFKLPASEFTAARNTLVSKLKKAGRTADAEQVKLLSRPTASAWAVNQLYWRHRKAFDRLLAAGQQFKKAQAAQLAGESADVRGPLSVHRDALAALTKLASTLLEDEGHSASPDTVRRITTTLEALATYGSQPDAPTPGRLTDDIAPLGFEALAALIPQNGRQRSGEPPKIIQFRSSNPPRQARKKETPEEQEQRLEEEHKARLAAAQDAVKQAERSLAESLKRTRQAEAALKTVAARAKELERERAAVEKTFEKATAAAEEARQDARRTAADAEEATQALEDAERAVEKARADLEGLNKD